MAAVLFEDRVGQAYTAPERADAPSPVSQERVSFYKPTSLE